MARCLQCNKFMLFRSSSGYCRSCETFIQQQKAHEEKAKEVEKASSVNKNPAINKENASKPTPENKGIGKSYLCANTDQIISADLIPHVFNMTDIVHEGQGYYLLRNENNTKALKDILSMNYYIS